MSRDYRFADSFGYAVPDSPKMLRETLCVAQARIGNGPPDPRNREHIERLERLIAECDRKRPLHHGKHDSLHTDECGCPGRSPR